MIVRVAAVCGDETLSALRTGVRQYADSRNASVNGVFFPDAHSFLKALEEESLWDLVIVATPGARGMETVVSARELAPETPLLWCSDDGDFAVASYRVRCSLFLTLPLRAEQVADALAQCLES